MRRTMMRSGTSLTVLDLDGRRACLGGSGRRWKSRPVSVLRSFKHGGLGPQIRRGGPAGQCPRSRMRRRYVVRVVVGPPRGIDARRVRQWEAEEVFDLRERQDHRVRVSMLQVLIQRYLPCITGPSDRTDGAHGAWPPRLLFPMFRPPVRSVVLRSERPGTRCGAAYLDFLAADRWSTFAVS
jgi:hypothetical protein